MNGGLFKTTSRTALAAVAASFAATSAMAADLGGNCCADLEERIAELEATTARKGNRKVSLTLSGWVHESIMFWDDGHERNAYYGVNNINVSSRFRMVGQAKIDAEWSAGYLIEIETQGKSDSNDINANSNVGGGTGLNTRHNAWWIDNKRLGRVWVGLTTPSSAGIAGIDLSNTVAAANVKVGLLNGSWQIRGTNGANLLTWSQALGGNNGLAGLGNISRNNIAKYVSPTLMGFIVSASVGEDDFWDASLKYANEFNGVRVAFGIGYGETTDGASAQNLFGQCAKIGTTDGDRDCSSLEIGGSIMHVPTGLFMTGAYGRVSDDLRVAEGAAAGILASAVQDEDTMWGLRGGIERNFIGLGKTTFYGEWESWEGGGMFGGNFATIAGEQLVETNVDVWGLGVVQKIDAAAMDLYLSYRNYSFDGKVWDGQAVVNAADAEDFSVITVGGRIQF